MLSQDELQRRIAEEFLRVGASQQSWDQNFPELPASVWVPGPQGTPVLSEESRTIREDFAYRGAAAAPDPPYCPPPSHHELIGGSWMCVLEDGSLVTPVDEEEVAWTPPVSGSPNPPVAAPQESAGAMPSFVGGRLGRVLFPQIANRKITGIRVGSLPQVVFGDEAPIGYGTIFGVHAAGGAGSENVEP